MRQKLLSWGGAFNHKSFKRIETMSLTAKGRIGYCVVMLLNVEGAWGSLKRKPVSGLLSMLHVAIVNHQIHGNDVASRVCCVN
jgi:hypothetical protein